MRGKKVKNKERGKKHADIKDQDTEQLLKDTKGLDVRIEAELVKEKIEASMLRSDGRKSEMEDADSQGEGALLSQLPQGL